MATALAMTDEDDESRPDFETWLTMFVGNLEKEAERRCRKRHVIEQRWLDDLRQYHGVYSNEVQDRIKDNESSDVNINLTAAKTDALEAKLIDLLFPTDDANWGIKPTPVPELAEAAKEAVAKAREAKAAADAAQVQMQEQAAAGDMAGAQVAEQDMRAAEDVEIDWAGRAAEAQEVIDEAKRRCEMMRREIDDQLVTSQWPSVARDMIGDACRLGAGIVKGPISGEKRKRSWVSGPEGFTLQWLQDDRPSAEYVEPYGFYPDPDVRRIEESESYLQRHLMNAKMLRDLAKQPGVVVDNVRALLKADPDERVPSFVAEIFAITGQSDGDLKDKYHVWEYRGPITAGDFSNLSEMAGRKGMEELFDDPLQDIQAMVLFCQGKVLRFALHPMDSGEPIYSMFRLRADDGSVWGYGIPAIMRDPAAIVNGAARMLMDNAGLATGPQIVVDMESVKPQDGKYRMTPRKIWEWDRDAAGTTATPPFQDYAIDMHQAELTAIIELGQDFIETVTAIPALAQGEAGPDPIRTAFAFAMLMQSANVVFKRIVKGFDDDVTVPLIRRMYDWNMQFNENEDIKGDYDVEARGSSVLLVRELQSQNLMVLAQAFANDPEFGPMMKKPKLFREMVRALMLPADEIVKTDEEIATDQEAAAGQPDPMAMEIEMKGQEFELRREELQAKIEIANMEAEGRKFVAQLTFDAKMHALAETLNMSADELRTKMADTEARIAMKNADLDSKERVVATEAAMAERIGKGGGGYV